MAAAHRALPGWAATPPRQRAECLRKAWALMIERSDAIARLMVLENGKALRDAKGEVIYAAEFFRWYAEEAVRIEGEVHTVMKHRRSWCCASRGERRSRPGISRDHGTQTARAGRAAPWCRRQETAVRVRGRRSCARPGFARRGQRGVHGEGRAWWRDAADPRVRSFTGSTEVAGPAGHGRADRDELPMELGGNAPFLTSKTPTRRRHRRRVPAKMRNGGEACTAANRFYMHDAVAGEFTSRFADRLSKLTVGPGLGEGFGPLVNGHPVRRQPGQSQAACGW